jgi:hypothetical protein
MKRRSSAEFRLWGDRLKALKVHCVELAEAIVFVAKGERVKPSTLAKVREFLGKRETKTNALQRPGA